MKNSAHDSRRPMTTYLPVDGSFDILEDWIQYRDPSEPNIIERHGLYIAKDGGVLDIDDLMYSTQYYYVLCDICLLRRKFLVCHLVRLEAFHGSFHL